MTDAKSFEQLIERLRATDKPLSKDEAEQVAKDGAVGKP